jgi:exodeoxyribonuclease VII small subunit
MTKKKQSFEASLEELEKIVGLLEEGDQPLEEALKLFESGVRISKECQTRLDAAERKIQVLLRDSDGDPAVEEFDNVSGEG